MQPKVVPLVIRVFLQVENILKHVFICYAMLALSIIICFLLNYFMLQDPGEANELTKIQLQRHLDETKIIIVSNSSILLYELIMLSPYLLLGGPGLLLAV
jgi:hypothetical protein